MTLDFAQHPSSFKLSRLDAKPSTADPFSVQQFLVFVKDRAGWQAGQLSHTPIPTTAQERQESNDTLCVFQRALSVLHQRKANSSFHAVPEPRYSAHVICRLRRCPALSGDPKIHQHSNTALSPDALSAVTAATQLKGDVSLRLIADRRYLFSYLGMMRQSSNHSGSMRLGLILVISSAACCAAQVMMRSFLC